MPSWGIKHYEKSSVVFANDVIHRISSTSWRKGGGPFDCGRKPEFRATIGKKQRKYAGLLVKVVFCAILSAVSKLTAEMPMRHAC